MQHVEVARSFHLPPYRPLVHMILEGTCFLQDHTQSDNRYRCVSIAHLSIGSSSMQWLPYCHQAYGPYLYHNQNTYCVSYPEAIGQTIDLG
jgi:hypothetical protein